MVNRQVFGFIEILFNHKLDSLEELIEVTEQRLEDELDNFEKRPDQTAKEYSEQERREYFEFMSDEYWKYKDDHPQIVRQSFFLQAYFSFEHLLNDICKMQQNLQLSLKDINGQGLERAKLYISKVIGLPNPFNNHLWRQIQYYNTVRNLYVHNAGEFDVNNNKHRLAKDNLNYISVNRSEEFILEKEFCIEVIETFRLFTNVLREEFENPAPR